jgi:hypothetical protein
MIQFLKKGDIMNNESALGYMILAAKELKLDKDIIKQLEAEMKYQMDMYTESEAEQAYNNFI